MIKRIMTTFIMVATLIFSGCGDSEGESRLETQYMLDKGNFSGVISKLEGKASSNEEYLSLASAYMGNAGLSLADLIKTVNDSTDTEGDAFASFINSIESSISDAPSPLTDLQKATKAYGKVLEGRCTAAHHNPELILSDTQKDVCLLMGLSQTLKAATAITYIADDVSMMVEDGEVDNNLKASACAIEYVFNGSSSNCTVLNENAVTFIQSQKTYDRITVYTDGESFEYLISSNSVSDMMEVVMTDGFCSLDDFSTRVADKLDMSYDASSYYTCPINTNPDAEELTVTNVLLDALNESTDAILAASGTNEDLKNSIDEIKCDIFGGIYEEDRCSVDLNQNITIEDIVEYIDEQNT